MACTKIIQKKTTIKESDHIVNAYRAYCYGMPLELLQLSDGDKKKLQLFIMYSSTMSPREIQEKTGISVNFASTLMYFGRRWRNDSKQVRVFESRLDSLRKRDSKFFQIVEKALNIELLQLIEESLKTGDFYSKVARRLNIRGFNVGKLRKFCELRRDKKTVTKNLLKKQLDISDECAQEIMKLIEKYSKDNKEKIKIKA